MESTRSSRGLGGRVMESAKALGGDVVGGGAGMAMEREMGDLSLRNGKMRSMAPPPSLARPQPLDLQHGSSRVTKGGREATMRTQRPDMDAAQKDFNDFAGTSQTLYHDSQDEAEDVLADFDFGNFLSNDRRYSHQTDLILPSSRNGHQCAEASAHALPVELRSLALDRLRQIESHLASSAATASESAKQAQRRADLENEWLLWWDESPTACFDDSKEYFLDRPQQSYTAAWQKHLEDPAGINVQKPGLHRQAPVPALRNDSLWARQYQAATQKLSPARPDEQRHHCPNRKSHEDLTACGRSTPIAAQHRPCPHTGCGFCSTSSAGYFEHLRTCII